MSNNTIVRLDSTNWGNYVKEVVDLRDYLCKGGLLGNAMTRLANIITHFSIVAPDQYGDIKESYQLLCEYLVRGYEDKHREDLYRQLIRRLIGLLSDMSLEVKLKYDMSSSYLSVREGNDQLDIDDLKERLEAFVSDSAMLSLEPEGDRSAHAKELYETRQNNISKAFISIVRSKQWTKDQAADMAALLLSPTIDTVDAQVLCSAVMMAALLSPDPNKVVTLMNVYRNATEPRLRQRALVGWVMAIDGGDYRLFPDVKSMLSSLLDDESVKEDVAELQIQVIYCMGAERDNETIQKDVMPKLLKNQNLEITRYGIKEKEDDPMEDILHSDEAEKRMEEMEKTVKQMADMQKRGVDIYFGGFSKMKRFGFFYTLCNWFMPFYSQHPGLCHIAPQMLDSGFLKSLFKHGPFCDSDKYSFALGMSSVFDRLPDNIKEMLATSTDAHIMGDSGVGEDTPMFFRRLYLQDLYRFFRINDSRSLFHDPFSDKNGHLFMDNSLYKEKLHTGAQRVTNFLLKLKMYSEAETIINRYYDDADLTDNLIKARLLMNSQEYKDAAQMFGKVLQSDVDNKAALKGAALASFYDGDYDKAIKLYKQLTEIYPDKTLYKLNLAISLINGNKADEGVNVLYELYYKYPSDMNVLRALAWGLLCTKKVEQASKLYKDILSSETKSSADSLNAGYCAWFSGDLEEAVTLFKDYHKEASKSKQAGTSLFQKFKDDKAILDKYDIPNVNRLLMAGMIN